MIGEKNKLKKTSQIHQLINLRSYTTKFNKVDYAYKYIGDANMDDYKKSPYDKNELTVALNQHPLTQ